MPIALPNAELLRASVTDFTRDFPFARDEVSAGVGDVEASGDRARIHPSYPRTQVQMLDGRP